MNRALLRYSKEELIEFIAVMAKNDTAIDGDWFQVIEEELGQEAAVDYDKEVWRRYTRTEARRIKNFLGLEEHPGIEGMVRALELHTESHANEYEIIVEDRAVTYRITDCRVQTARTAKGLGFHPCKPVGLIEYEGFGEVIDDRLICECVSCYPDMTDESCACAWRYRLPDEADAEAGCEPTD